MSFQPDAAAMSRGGPLTSSLRAKRLPEMATSKGFYRHSRVTHSQGLAGGSHAYFSDDNMYNETVLLWKAGDTKWVVLTPDMDVYVEDFSGHGDPGCDFFKIKTVDFKYWSRVGGACYRFRQDPSDDELKEKITEAMELLGGEVDRANAWRPTGIILIDGSVKDASVFLGRAVGGRRLRGKGPPTRIWRCSVLPAGQDGGRQLSRSLGTALFKRGDEWVKAELIWVEDCGDYAARRRLLFKDPSVAASPPTPAVKLIDQIASSGKKHEEDEKSDEVRTLWVDFDEHAERFKRWRDVCKECYTPVFDEKPIEGPLTALHFIKHAERHGGDMRQ